MLKTLDGEILVETQSYRLWITYCIMTVQILFVYNLQDLSFSLFESLKTTFCITGAFSDLLEGISSNWWCREQENSKYIPLKHKFMRISPYLIRTKLLALSIEILDELSLLNWYIKFSQNMRAILGFFEFSVNFLFWEI